MIGDHVFRGLNVCLYPQCGQPEGVHRESADPLPVPTPHWFLGVRACGGCGLGFNHPAHFFSPSRIRLTGLR